MKSFLFDRGAYDYPPLPRVHGLPPWRNPPSRTRKRLAHKKLVVTAKQKAKRKKK